VEDAVAAEPPVLLTPGGRQCRVAVSM